uniref:Uncharacterized protein n=1 Tax=Arundo donax TaxID=35708 RepID=A0A0A8YWA0_ARUDO
MIAWSLVAWWKVFVEARRVATPSCLTEPTWIFNHCLELAEDVDS